MDQLCEQHKNGLKRHLQLFISLTFKIQYVGGYLFNKSYFPNGGTMTPTVTAAPNIYTKFYG